MSLHIAELSGPVSLDGAQFVHDGDLPTEYPIPVPRSGLRVSCEVFLLTDRKTSAGHRVLAWAHRRIEDIQPRHITESDQAIEWWKSKV